MFSCFFMPSPTLQIINLSLIEKCFNLGLFVYEAKHLSYLLITYMMLFCESRVCVCVCVLRFYLFGFGQKGGKEKERERNIEHLHLACPQLGTWPTTQACALTGIELATLWFAGLYSVH